MQGKDVPATDAPVVLLAPALTAVRDAFVRWQCSARQFAMRRDAGRPTQVMRPKVLTADGAEVSPGIITVLIERDPEASTAIFRHIYRRTHDPAERRAALLEKMAGTFFQQPARFSDTLTALFLPGSKLAERLVSNRDCVLDFARGATRLGVACRVDDLGRAHPFYQATWYHNALFNPNLPADASVLAFNPDWARSEPRTRQ